jgi:hypothetical protein
MVLFALVVVVILGTIGLVIEMGTVRVTRERMQSAADAVALEVLRERDWDPGGTGDPYARDRGRRERNRVLASWTFANQLQGTYEESEQGAGPFIDMTPSVPEADFVNRSLILNEVGHSVPVLRTNYDGSGGVLNKKNGDIVSGTFKGYDGGSIGFGGNPIYRENGDYDRVDFTAANGPDAPMADSVLVRLRRTVPHGQPGGPWNDLEDHVSSSGWTMPLVFGLGSTFIGSDPTQGYSIRHHGLPMRATAIAQAKPAVRIGVPNPSMGAEWAVGAGPLVFRFAEWGHPSTFELDPSTDRYSAVLRLRPPSYEVVSVFHDSNVIGFLYPVIPSQIGDLMDEGKLEPDIQPDGSDANLDPEFWAVGECFLPLYLFGTATEWRVCGYARVSIDAIPHSPDFPHHEAGDQYIRVTKLPNLMSPGEPYVSPRNASSTLDGLQPASIFESSSTKSWDDLILALYQTVSTDGGDQYVFESRVYAPAHVR